MAKMLNFKKDYLQNEIRMRYAQDSILPWDDNRLAFKLVSEGIQKSEIKDLRILNPNIREMSSTLIENLDPKVYNSKEFLDGIFIQKILSDLDLTPTKEDFQKIREQDLNLVFVGVGGAMLNLLWNMYHYAIKFSEIGVFNKIRIFEKDNIDFTNLFRIGKPVLYDFAMDFSTDYSETAQNIKQLKKLFLVKEEKLLSKENKIITFDSWLQDIHVKLLKKKNYTLVGAPTLETRKFLEDSDFYFLGHSDFEVDLVYQPEPADGLAVETYGTIDIPVLMLNLHLATAAFIKQLASGKKPAKNEKLFSFDMKEYLKNHPELEEYLNV